MGSHLSEQFSKLHEGVWGDQPDEETFAAVKSALDCGINFFDTVSIYVRGQGNLSMLLKKIQGFARESQMIKLT